MAKKYLAFDIETIKPFPDGEDWRPHRPLGMSCAAAHSEDMDLTWFSRNSDGTIADQMSPEDLRAMVEELATLTQPENGYTIVTWNGLGFDFDVLAEESGMQDVCERMALYHVDMMFHLFAVKGYLLGLETASKGMGLPGKTEGMDGRKAIEMWADGDRQPVIDYCAQDVRATLDLALECQKQGRLEWQSRSGRRQILAIRGGWMNVKEAMSIQEPDTSWMTDPIPRSNFTGWLRPDQG